MMPTEGSLTSMRYFIIGKERNSYSLSRKFVLYELKQMGNGREIVMKIDYCDSFKRKREAIDKFRSYIAIPQKLLLQEV